jgi:hypothetical protein
MYSYQDSDDRIPTLQMNSELQHAQLELLSAHCATHQLRLHYSSDDLARFGRRDVLRKSAEAASALNEFYSAIERKIPPSPLDAAPLSTTGQTAQATQCVCTYLRQQRDHYFPAALALSNHQKRACGPIFPPRCSIRSASSNSKASVSPRLRSTPRPALRVLKTCPKSPTWTP